MSNAAALVAQLAAAGTPPELLAAVAQELFRAEVELAALGARRKNERERKAKSREVTGQPVTGCDAPSPLTSPLKVSPDPIKITPPITPQPDLVVSGETTLPAEQIEDLGIKPEHVIEAWNMTAEPLGLQRVRKMTPERRRKLNTFIRRHSIDEITEGIAAIPRSPFLRGENPRGWRADFDWMLEPKNFTKLQEGNYG